MSSDAVSIDTGSSLSVPLLSCLCHKNMGEDSSMACEGIEESETGLNLASATSVLTTPTYGEGVVQ